MIACRLLALIAAALWFVVPALAQNNWNVPGSGCVPTGETVSNAGHKTTVSSVMFAVGETGQIVLICPMPRFNSGTVSYLLKLTYQDPNGSNNSASVSAQLYRMANEATDAVQLGAVNSNNSTATGPNTFSSFLITHTFDFEANIYWVRVVLKRNGTNQDVVFHSVVLDGTAF